MGWGGGWRCPPLLAILSHSGGAILCPLAEALGASLAEDPIGLGDRAVVMEDPVAVGCHGTVLKGTATVGVSLGEVQQQGCPVASDHSGLGDQQGGDTLGVTHEGGEAGGGDQLDHGSQVVVGVGFPPPVECIVDPRGGICLGGEWTDPRLAQNRWRSALERFQPSRSHWRRSRRSSSRSRRSCQPWFRGSSTVSHWQVWQLKRRSV